jgi:acetyl esterase/lipase
MKITAPAFTSLLAFTAACVAAHGQDAANPPAPATSPAPATQPAKQKPAIQRPDPTEANVRYGPFERNVLDFWKADTKEPAPVLLYIHGGGWQGGDKASLNPTPYLRAGISVVAINYRYISQSQDVEPPVKAPLHDAARALQFVRSKAAEWHLDKNRIVANGGSAGACTSLWLAFHRDLADPQSTDPIARESTRLSGAAVSGAQTTLDPAQMKEWTPNSKYGAHAFKINAPTSGKGSTFDEFLAKRETLLPWIAEYSPYALVTADAPPIFLGYASAPALGEPQKDPTHTSNFGVKLQDKLRSVGVKCDLQYPGAEGLQYESIQAAIFGMLKVSQ